MLVSIVTFDNNKMLCFLQFLLKTVLGSSNDLQKSEVTKAFFLVYMLTFHLHLKIFTFFADISSVAFSIKETKGLGA